jgi:apolipoprotein N-acyltransferase
VLAVVVIVLFAAYIVLDEAGIPRVEQRPVRIALMVVVSLWVATCVGRFFIRPTGSSASGRSKADYHNRPPDTH